MANRSLFAIGGSGLALAAIGLVFFSPLHLLHENVQGSLLSPCSKEGTFFETVPFVLKPGEQIDESTVTSSISCIQEALLTVNERSKAEAEKKNATPQLTAVWPEMYHHCTERIIDEHLAMVFSSDSIRGATLRCTEENYQQVLPPTGVLRELLLSLPPWQQPSNSLFGPPIELEVSEADLGPGLLEFVRLYECALAEQGEVVGLSFKEDEVLELTEVASQELQEITILDQEISSARKALDRTLTIIGGIDRLQPLQTELNCLERTSTEIRNGLGLLSETLSCLNRSLDTRSSLHDTQ